MTAHGAYLPPPPPTTPCAVPGCTCHDTSRMAGRWCGLDEIPVRDTPDACPRCGLPWNADPRRYELVRVKGEVLYRARVKAPTLDTDPGHARPTLDMPRKTGKPAVGADPRQLSIFALLEAS